MDILKLICKTEGLDNEFYIYKLMKFIEDFLTSGKNPRTNENLDLKTTEYLLHALEFVSDHAMDEPLIFAGLEIFIKNHVVPNLFSENPAIRARACSLIKEYGQVDIKDPETITSICKGVCQNMEHGEIPVQMKAIQALRTIIIHKSFRNILTLDLKYIL